jgi:hypothetical protein
VIAPTVPPSWRILTDVFHPLFGPDPIGQAFDLRRKKALECIAEQPAYELRAANLDELAAHLVTPYLMAPLELRWKDRGRLPNENEIEVDHGRSRMPPSVSPMGEFAFVVPYSGTLGLFDLRPTREVGQPPSGYVWASQGLLEYSVARADVATARRARQQVEAAIKRWAAWVNQDVSTFNAELLRSMRQGLATRLDEIRADDDILAALDIPEATLELRHTPRDAPRHPELASKVSPVEANGGQLPVADEPASVPGPQNGHAYRTGKPGPSPMLTRERVERMGQDLASRGLPDGERSIARELGASRDAVRYALGKDRGRRSRS